MDPFDPSILYFGTYRVWKTTDLGNSWTPMGGDLTQGGSNYFHTITTLAVSRLNSSIIVAGCGDGKLQVSQTGGLAWSDRTAGLPDRWITHVATDPFDVNTIYATLSGFRWDEPLPHVFKSTNLGQTWSDITGNLPEFPVNDLVLDPMVEGRIIVGTDAGMYGTYDGGQTWFWIWNDLPPVPVCAIKIHPDERIVVAGTYGLSTYTASLDDIFTGIPQTGIKTTLKISVTPNPVSAVSQLRFHLPESDDVTIRIVAGNGQTIATLFNGKFEKGDHQLTLSSLGSVSAGVYFIMLEGKKFTAVCKAIRL